MSEKVKEFGNKAGQMIGKIYRYVVTILFALITLWLFGVNIFSTSYMQSVQEHTYYSADNPWVNLLLLFGFSAVLLIFSRTEIFAVFRKKLEDDCFFVRCRRVLLFALFLEGVVLVVTMQGSPVADQKSIVDVAWKLFAGEEDIFLPGGYIERYPVQAGVSSLIYVFSIFFGHNNYLVFQLFNVGCLVLVYKSFERIADSFGMGRVSRFLIYIYGILFLPLTFYVLFVYGNLSGLAFALAAVSYEIRYFDREDLRTRGAYFDILRAAALIALAIMVKPLYLVFFIAMLIYALMKVLKDRSKFPIAFFIFAAAFYLLQSFLPTAYMEHRAGVTLDGGSNLWAVIAMGLQDNEKRANGWYNGYNYSTYSENEYDSVKQGEMAKENIDERVKYFLAHKDEAMEFFKEKNASQWNNPTFQCFWIVQGMGSRVIYPSWFRYMISVDGSYIFYRIFDFLQMITLFGAVLYLFVGRNRGHYGYLFFEIIIIGGFVFHTFWEAKGQYTILYYVCFLPIAVKGYAVYVNRFSVLAPRILRKERKPEKPLPHDERVKSSRGLALLAAGMLAGVMLFAFNGVCHAWVSTDRDTEEYAQYVERHRYDDVADGVYKIHPANDPSLTLAVEVTGSELEEAIYLTADDSVDTRVEVRTLYDRVYIRFFANSLYLDLHKNSEGDGAYADAYPLNYTTAQQWGLKETGKGGYFLRIRADSALAFEEESGMPAVEPFNYGGDQEWILEKVEE